MDRIFEFLKGIGLSPNFSDDGAKLLVLQDLDVRCFLLKGATTFFHIFYCEEYSRGFETESQVIHFLEQYLENKNSDK